MSLHIFQTAAQLVDHADVSETELADLSPVEDPSGSGRGHVTHRGDHDTEIGSLSTLERKIYFQPSSTVNRDCHNMMSLLKYGRFNEWFSAGMSSRGETLIEGERADTRVEIPMVRLGAALPIGKMAEREALSHDRLTYVIVIQGQGGGDLQKLLLCDSIKEAGETIFFEALNGYSIVFTAAITSAAANLIARLSKRDPEHLLESITFIRAEVGHEGHRVSRRYGWEQRPTQLRDMKISTNLDIEKGPLTVGFVN